MSEENWNKVFIIVLLVSIGTDFIALFAQIRAQRLDREAKKCDEATKKEISQLHTELKSLKKQLEEIREDLVSTKSSDAGRNLSRSYLRPGK